jgi:hypothetical protein
MVTPATTAHGHTCYHFRGFEKNGTRAAERVQNSFSAAEFTPLQHNKRDVGLDRDTVKKCLKHTAWWVSGWSGSMWWVNAWCDCRCDEWADEVDRCDEWMHDVIADVMSERMKWIDVMSECMMWLPVWWVSGWSGSMWWVNAWCDCRCDEWADEVDRCDEWMHDVIADVMSERMKEIAASEARSISYCMHTQQRSVTTQDAPPLHNLHLKSFQVLSGE